MTAEIIHIEAKYFDAARALRARSEMAKFAGRIAEGNELAARSRRYEEEGARIMRRANEAARAAVTAA